MFLQTQLIRCGTFLFFCVYGLSQNTGTLSGTVILEAPGTPVHDATVRIVQLGRSVSSDNEGRYRFTGLPPGAYTVLAHLHDFTDESQRVHIRAGASTTAGSR